MITDKRGGVGCLNQILEPIKDKMIPFFIFQLYFGYTTHKSCVGSCEFGHHSLYYDDVSDVGMDSENRSTK